MALQWHPYLTQFLRRDYGDRLQIEAEVNLGEMPLRLDILIIRRDRALELPFPFNYLGQRTLLEYNGPEEPAGQVDLVKAEAYALLYGLREAIAERGELTLWLVANSFSPGLSDPNGALLESLETVGPGVQRGRLDRFTVYLLSQSELPVTAATLPLVMVSRGRRERELVEFLLRHHTVYRDYVNLITELHGPALKELTQMTEATSETTSVTWKEIADIIGLDRLVEMFGPERVVESLGADRVLESLGPDRLLEMIGPERAREWLQHHGGEGADSSPHAPANGS